VSDVPFELLPITADTPEAEAVAARLTSSVPLIPAGNPSRFSILREEPA